MPLPVVKNEIKGSFFKRIKEGSNNRRLHDFFVEEAERIRAYNPEIISAIEFFSKDDVLVVETPDGTILANMPPELKDGIERRIFDLAVKVYLLLESQAESDDMVKEIKLD